MGILAVLRRLSSACTVLFGPHGAVTAHARQRHCSRQQLYREADHVVADLEQSAAQARCAALEQELACCRQQLHDWQHRLAGAAAIPAERQAEFAALAQALGVSLTQAHDLEAIREDYTAFATFFGYLNGGFCESLFGRSRRSRSWIELIWTWASLERVE